MQVPKHHRVTEQLLRVLAFNSSPPVSEEEIRGILADMVRNGYLDEKGGIYQPASAGWEFIESNKIYTNIQPTPLEVALVDVETGQVVVTVAAVGGSSGVRVAGRSYDFVPGGSSTHKRVRSGGDHAVSPRYHTHSLPYASDLGSSLASFFGIESGVLAAMQIGDSLLVMTWLGRLLNSVLAAGLGQRKQQVADGAFHLTIKDGQEKSVVPMLRKAVDDVLLKNPLGTMAVERMVDLGPHFECLSPSQQAKACEDWRDGDFLRRWVDGIREVKMISAGSALGDDILSLI
jgi:hypothetical protein